MSDIATTAMTLGPEAGDDDWGVVFYSTDCTTCESIKAAPGSGRALCIDVLFVQGDADITADIGDGEATNAVETKLFTAVGFADGSKMGPLNLRGQQLTTNKPMTICGSGAGNLNGYVLGHTKYP